MHLSADEYDLLVALTVAIEHGRLDNPTYKGPLYSAGWSGALDRVMQIIGKFTEGATREVVCPNCQRSWSVPINFEINVPMCQVCFSGVWGAGA